MLTMFAILLAIFLGMVGVIALDARNTWVW